jgi:protein-S-isoprenylcysteine O-methyltransferase Ste14
MTSSDTPRVLIPPPLIFGGLLVSGLALDGNSPSLGPAQVFGIAIAAAGVGLIAIALGLFRRSRTRPEPWQPASTLVIGGIYRRTRNPMYLGMALFSFGLALVFTSLAGCVSVALAAVVIDRFVIEREEAYLTRRFGEEYRVYRGRVRRWI